MADELAVNSFSRICQFRRTSPSSILSREPYLPLKGALPHPPCFVHLDIQFSEFNLLLGVRVVLDQASSPLPQVLSVDPMLAVNKSLDL